MKRKIGWLAVPLVLLALVLGVKWRIEHPTPTQEDLKMRALLATYSSMEVACSSSNSGVGFVDTQLTRQELQPFIECFYLSRQQPQKRLSRMNLYSGVTLRFAPPDSMRTGSWIYIYLDAHQGTNFISDPARSLHPLTIKRWKELLLANPRVGPELRARLKS